jgi:hypothetical protein
MALYEVAYSTKTASDDELSFSDIVLGQAETYEELYTKVVDTLLHTLGLQAIIMLIASGMIRMDWSLRSESQRRRPKIWTN